jgi:hypothetical protein
MSRIEKRKSFLEELLETANPLDLRAFLNKVQGIEDHKASALEPEFARDTLENPDELDGVRWADDFYASRLGILTFQGPAGAPERWTLRWQGKQCEETVSGRAESRSGTLRLYDLPPSIRPLSLTAGNAIYDDDAVIDASCEFVPETLRISKPEDLLYENNDSYRLAADSEEEESSLSDLGLAAGTVQFSSEHLTVDWEHNICAVKLRTTVRLKDTTPVKLGITDLGNSPIGEIEGKLAYQSEASQGGVRWYTYEANFLVDRPRDQDQRDLPVRLILSARDSQDIISNPASSIETSSSVLDIGVLEYGSCAFHQGQKAREFEQFVLRFVVDAAGVLIERNQDAIDRLIDHSLDKDETRKWLSFTVKDERNYEKQIISKESGKPVLKDGIRFAVQTSLLEPRTQILASGNSVSEEETMQVTKDFLRVIEILAACKDWSNNQSWNLRAFEFVSGNLEYLKKLQDTDVIGYVVQASKRSFRLHSQNDTIGGNRYRNQRERFRRLLKSGKDFAEKNGLGSLTTGRQVAETDPWFKGRIKALKSREQSQDEREQVIRQVVLASLPVANAVASNFENEMQSLGYCKTEVVYIAIGCVLAEVGKKRISFRPEYNARWVEYLKSSITKAFQVVKVVNYQTDGDSNGGMGSRFDPEFSVELYTHELKFEPQELDDFYREFSPKCRESLYALLRSQHIPDGVTEVELLGIRRLNQESPDPTREQIGKELMDLRVNHKLGVHSPEMPDVRGMQQQMGRQWRLWKVLQQLENTNRHNHLLDDETLKRLRDRIHGHTRFSSSKSDRRIDCLCAILELRTNESIDYREVKFLEDWLLKELSDSPLSQNHPFDDVESLKHNLGTKVHAQLLIADIVKREPLLNTQELRKIAKLWLIDGLDPNWEKIRPQAAEIHAAWERLDSLVPSDYRRLPDYRSLSLRNDVGRNQTIGITR